MASSRNWLALKKTGVIVVDDVELELRKRGVKRIISDVTAVPLLGDAIELIVERSVAAKGKTDFGALIKDALIEAASKTGGSAGKIARDVLLTLPDVIVNVFVEDVVLADEGEKPDFREWIESLGPTEIVALGLGWVELNLPQLRGPLVAALASLRKEAGKAVETAQAGATVATAPAPAAVEETPAAAEESLAA